MKFLRLSYFAMAFFCTTPAFAEDGGFFDKQFGRGIIPVAKIGSEVIRGFDKNKIKNAVERRSK